MKLITIDKIFAGILTVAGFLFLIWLYYAKPKIFWSYWIIVAAEVSIILGISVVQIIRNYKKKK